MSHSSLPEHLCDDEVVRRVQAGDHALFELLVRRHNQRLYRAARGILKSPQAAEDAVQEAHIAAFTKLSTFEFRAKYATWVTRIAVRQALSARRGRQAATTSIAGHILEESMSDPAHSPERRAASAELGAIIEAALDELQPEFRAVFILREIEGMSTAETAVALDLVPATVKTRLHRAKEHLKALLERRSHDALPSVHAFDGARCDRITHAVMSRVLQETP